MNLRMRARQASRVPKRVSSRNAGIDGSSCVDPQAAVHARVTSATADDGPGCHTRHGEQGRVSFDARRSDPASLSVRSWALREPGCKLSMTLR